jgi:hypothetical protein
MITNITDITDVYPMFTRW